jgi:hypothetical protein
MHADCFAVTAVTAKQSASFSDSKLLTNVLELYNIKVLSRIVFNHNKSSSTRQKNKRILVI